MKHWFSIKPFFEMLKAFFNDKILFVLVERIHLTTLHWNKFCKIQKEKRPGKKRWRPSDLSRPTSIYSLFFCSFPFLIICILMTFTQWLFSIFLWDLYKSWFSQLWQQWQILELFVKCHSNIGNSLKLILGDCLHK